MFVHIGGQVSVAVRDLVAMLDLKTAMKSPLSAEFLSRTDEGRSHRVVSVDGLGDGQEPRCVVVTSSVVYLSPISLATLRRRLEVVHTDLQGAGAPAPVVDKGPAV
ncbi:MAG: extracellular matrix regulator RemB [Clostridia bacterium]